MDEEDKFVDEIKKIINCIQELFVLNKFKTKDCLMAMMILTSTQHRVSMNGTKKEFLEFAEYIWDAWDGR